MTIINVYLEPNSSGNLIYYPGHILRGTVELLLDHVENIQCFYVTVVGRADVNWEETKTRSVGTTDDKSVEFVTENSWGREDYLDAETYFLGHKKGPTITLQPGIHRYSFSCQLPHKLPSSLSTRLGSITYSAIGSLDIPNHYIKDGHVPFEVVRYDDLNLCPELRLPFKFEEVKSFRCIYCASGTLVMTVTTPCTGFALGQSVPIKIDYVNKSNVDVKQTRVSLKRVIVYTYRHPEKKTKIDSDIMLSIVSAGAKSKESNYFESILEVPTTLVCSNEGYCKVITISYSIEIEGEIGGCHGNTKICFPVTIGSLPARAIH